MTIAPPTTSDDWTLAPANYSLHENSSDRHGNETDQPVIEVDDSGWAQFDAIVRVTVPVIFGAIAVLGLVGNLLVIIVVVRNRTMRSTTNALIVSLAVADLVFIVICVPLTALSYTQAPWVFGRVVCRLYQNVIHVTAYASVYTLVLMSLDRYLAVVHPIRSMTLRTERNACVLIGVVWTLIAVGHVPSFTDFDLYVYPYEGGERSICINKRLLREDGLGYDFIYAQVRALAKKNVKSRRPSVRCLCCVYTSRVCSTTTAGRHRVCCFSVAFTFPRPFIYREHRR
jgi:7 transmembrane receptor (rhodopsin family)